MQVHRNLANLPSFNRAVITIGTFDGVHTGHRQIIHQLKHTAEKIQGETVIITFDPHPRKVVHESNKEIRLINTLDEKIELLAQSGIDHLVVIPFTEAFSRLTAEEYIGEFLISKFHPHTIIIGYDHRFGKGRIGNYQLMEELSPKYGYELCEIPVHVLNAVSVSSTRIREAIAKADIATANQLLGYVFFFQGRVIEGKKLGKSLGFPTANLQPDNPEKIIPADGVYAVRVALPGKTKLLKGMMNIGLRPTVDGTTRMIEVNIFDFAGDIYGQTLRVYVEKHLRAEQKFASLDALKEQLNKDRMNAEAALGDILS